MYWLLHPIHLLLLSHSVVNKGMIGGSLRTAPPLCTLLGTLLTLLNALYLYLPLSNPPCPCYLRDSCQPKVNEEGARDTSKPCLPVCKRLGYLASIETANVSHFHFLSHFRRLIVLRQPSTLLSGYPVTLSVENILHTGSSVLDAGNLCMFVYLSPASICPVRIRTDLLLLHG